MQAAFVAHSLIGHNKLPAFNTPTPCLFQEYDDSHIKRLRVRTCTLICVPDIESGEMKTKWIQHNSIGNVEVYPIGWIELTDKDSPVSIVPWLSQMHRWGKVEFKFISGEL
jgi:hypothetical protein